MKMRAALLIPLLALNLNACGSTAVTAVPAANLASSARQTAPSAHKIYVANIGNGTITTYLPDGTQTTPTISTGNYLFAIAVAPSGKIYALTFDPLSGPSSDGTITSYEPDGTKTTPTITVKERGYSEPVGIAVDPSGKIYLLSSARNGSPGMVTSYRPDGRPTKPTFTAGADSSSIVVDAAGKIYVTNEAGPSEKGSVTTYFPDGSPATPIITRRIHQPVAIAVAQDGKIYVANTNNRGPDGTVAGDLVSYTSQGDGPLQTVKDREAPGGIAISGGRLYLASSNAYSSTLKTFTLAGRRISPTIKTGLDEPSAIALSP
jgi:sugar lactone lactonase YvrE